MHVGSGVGRRGVGISQSCGAFEHSARRWDQVRVGKGNQGSGQGQGVWRCGDRASRSIAQSLRTPVERGRLHHVQRIIIVRNGESRISRPKAERRRGPVFTTTRTRAFEALARRVPLYRVPCMCIRIRPCALRFDRAVIDSASDPYARHGGSEREAIGTGRS